MIEGRTLPSAVVLEDVLRRGREALAAGRVESALRTFDAAIRIKPSYAPAWRAKGRALRATGDAKAALDCYAEALRHEPGDEASWFGLALTLHALGRRKDEMLAYEELLRRNPRNVAAWMNRGVALHEAGRYEEALRCHDRILAARPEVAAAWNNRGAALLRLGRPDDALASFDEAVSLEPTSSDAATNRRTVLAKLGRDAPEPPAFVVPSAEVLPDSAQPCVLGNLGLPALEAWRRGPPAGADGFASLGAVLLDEGAPEAALAAFRKSESIAKSALSALGKAMALEILHDPRVRAEADHLLQFVDSPRAAIAAARIREEGEDLAGTWDAYRALLDRHPRLGWVWGARGILELRMSRVFEARASFERATQEDPSDVEAWANLAAALHRDNRSDEALAACDKALAVDPDCAVALNNRGVILAAMGRSDDAESAFRHAARFTREGTLAANRAQLAESRGQFRAALRFYDAAIVEAPEDREFLAARRRVLGRIGARGRRSRGRLVSRMCAVPGIGPATARRILRAGFDSPAKIRGAPEAELREAARLTREQARAVRRAFRS